MKKENSSNQKKNNNFLAAAVSLILSAALFAVDLFLLLNQPRNFIGLIGTTLLMLIWIYFFVRAVFQELEQNKQVMTSYLEAMLKSEKAFFLMQRKVLNEMQQFGEDAKLPSEEIITAQKAIAKVTINRSRENTDALMNSNNQLLDRLADFEDKLSSFHTDAPMTAPTPTPEPIERPDPMLENSVRDILTEQRMIVENMQRMEAAIKDEVLKAVSSINEMQSKMPVYVQEPVRQEVNIPLEDELNRGITLESVSSMNADFGMTQATAPEVFPAEVFPAEEVPAEEVPTAEIPIGEMATGRDIGAPEDIVIDNDAGAPEDIIVDGDIGAPEDIVVGEDIGAPEDIIVDGDIGAPEDIIVGEDIGSAPSAEGVISAAAPVEEELPDIDSLLSSIENLGITEEVPETISEPISELEPEPVPEPEPEPEPIEEKPVMPDLSNPRKMMTPDEIAALLANM